MCGYEWGQGSCIELEIYKRKKPFFAHKAIGPPMYIEVQKHTITTVELFCEALFRWNRSQ